VDSLPAGNSARTVELWARDATDQTGRPLVSWGNGNNEDQLFSVIEGADGITVNAAYDSVSLPSSQALDDGTWHLITVVYNGTKLAVYVDGVSIGTAQFTGTLDTAASLLAIGDYTSASIADVAIYPTALSTATIAAHYKASGAASDRTRSPASRLTGPAGGHSTGGLG
jgi:hypothetical protein